MLGKCDFHSSKFVFCIFFSVFSRCVPWQSYLSRFRLVFLFLLIFSSILSSSAVRFHLRVLGGRGNRVPSKLPNIHFETRPPPSLHPKNIFISSVFTPLLLHFFLLIFFSSYPDDFLSSDSSGVQHFLLPLLVLAQTSVNKRALCWTFLPNSTLGAQ